MIELNPPHGVLTPTCPGPVPNPHKPVLRLPENSCDSHCHVLGPSSTFPFAPASQRSYTPPEAPLEALEIAWDLLGFNRAVLVQSVTHGRDHSVVVNALRRGNGRYRAVGLIQPDTPASEVERLHNEGFRGARLHFMSSLTRVPDPDEIQAVIDKVRDYDWHLAVHVAGDGILEYEDLIASLPGRVVIDHMARVDLRNGLDTPAITALLRLLERDNIWVKLSGADRIAINPPSMADSVALATLLAKHAPERTVWGSDYPHVNTYGFMADDGDLVDAIAQIAPTEEARRLLLVENPTVCFDFAG